ncbi:MAG: hypothetical protein Q9192_004710 [Flavoplaca navasiana]
MDDLYSALMKALTKAKAQAGLLGIMNQQCKFHNSLPSAMIIDQTQNSRGDAITTFMGQIYVDIESARITRQTNYKLMGRLSSVLSSEDKMVREVLEYTASWLQVENNVTAGRAVTVPTSVPSEISHVCRRFASVKLSHGWMIFSILAHSESFRNACRTFDTPLWDQLMHDIGQNHVSLELFFKVRGLDWVTPLRSITHLIPEQELQSYLRLQAKRELPNVFFQSPHSYVVPGEDGVLQRPHYQSILHLTISSNTYDTNAFAEDPSTRIQNDGTCENCGRRFCDCEPLACDRITRPLTELIHCSAEKGIGVRTLQRINAGDVLDEYVGQLKRATTVADQTYAMELEGLPAGHQSRNDNDPILIDAQVYGNWTRYINASCNPSLKFVPARIGGKHRVMVVAIRDINTFEELTIGYGDDYWLGSDTKMCECYEETCRHATMAQKEKARWGCAVAFQDIQRSNSARRIVLDASADRMDVNTAPPHPATNRAHNKKNQNPQNVGGQKTKRSTPDQPSHVVHHPSPYQHIGVVSPHNNNHRKPHRSGGNKVKGHIPACPKPIRR